METVGSMKTGCPPQEAWGIAMTFPGSIIGTIVGIVPGAGRPSPLCHLWRGGPMQAQEEMGTGIPEGIVAPRQRPPPPSAAPSSPSDPGHSGVAPRRSFSGLSPPPSNRPAGLHHLRRHGLHRLRLVVPGHHSHIASSDTMPSNPGRDPRFPESVVSTFIMLLCFIGAFSIGQHLRSLAHGGLRRR